jgi:nucleoside-diphosphate-sugar epimerase
VTIQISDTYGLCDRRQKLFNLLKKACVSQASLDMSKGEQYLDLVYIDDVVDAYLKTIEYLLQKDDNSHEIFQIGTGKPKKLKDVVYLFQKIAGKKITVNFGGRPYRKREMMYTKANIGKAKKVLGWRPKISLNRGINILIKENYD